MSEPARRYLAGYELLEPLGQGGMGTVFRARTADGSVVAIKIAHRIIDDPLLRSRFHNEAHLNLRHPNVVRLLDSGIEEDDAYLVFEFLEGETLGQRLQRGPMSCEEVVELGTQLCAGLAAAHAEGLVHRDIKPGNVMCSPDGHYTLIDFGLALWSADETRITRHGEVLGTPAYLPPEQARGDIEIDGRSDLWSLAVLLYEALSGTSPFLRETPLATLMAVVMDEPTPIGELAPTASAELRVCLSRALSKERDARWQSAEDFAHALRNLPSRPDIARAQTEDPLLSESERRLVAVLLAENVQDGLALGHAVAEKRGVFIQLGSDRAVGIFGGLSTFGDELVRAAQVGLSCLSSAERLSVASGHTTGRRSVVSGQTLAAAEKACEKDVPGVAAAPAAARALAGAFEVQTIADTHVIVAPRSSEEGARLLIGRELELAQILRAAEQSAEEEELRMVLVTGPRGIGKSALARRAEASIEAQVEDVLVMRGNAEPATRDTALSLVAGLIRSHLQSEIEAGGGHAVLDAQSIEGLFPDGAEMDRSRGADFLAELVGAPTRDSVEIVAARADPQLRRDQMYLAMRSYITALAQLRPLVILVEDLHWADADSLELLKELALASVELPLCVVGTALPEEHERYLPLFEVAVATGIDLPPLSGAQVAKLAEAIACRPIKPVVAKELAKRTHGNPLFVEHLVQDMTEELGEADELTTLPLPLTVEAAIQSRLDHLSLEDKQACKLSAIFAHSFSAAHLEAIGATDAAATLERLATDGVLRREKRALHGRERHYCFRSRLVAEVAYGMLLSEQRRDAHRRAAQFLSLRNADDALDVARHYELGEARQDASYWFALATHQALSRGDSKAVLRCADAALRLAPGVRDFEMHMARSDVFRFRGQREEQCEALEEALAAVRTPTQKARALTEFAWNQSRLGQGDRALSLAEEAVAAARDAGDPESLALSLGWRSVALAQLGRLDESLEALGEATSAAEGVSEKVDALVTVWRAQVYGARGDLAQRLLAFSDAEAQFTRVGDVRRAAGAACNVADLFNRLGDYEQAERELRQGREGCRQVNNRMVEGYATANLAYSLIGQGRGDEALQELAHATALAKEANELVLRIVSGIYECRALVQLGRQEEAMQRGRELADESLSSGIAPLAAMALTVASSAALGLGRARDALVLAREGMDILEELGGLEEDEGELYLALAKALEACGQGEEGAQVRERGRSRLTAMLEGITEPALKESFEAIPAHAQLLAS